MRYYCDVVYALYDPRSQDNTLEILTDYAEKYKNSDVPLHILEQNINLGDSYRGHTGPNKQICFLANMNKFIQKYVPIGTWTLCLAGDERLNPHEREKMFEFLLYAEYENFNALSFDIYDVYPDIDHYANYNAIFKGKLYHRKMIKRSLEYRYNLTPHSNYSGGEHYIQPNLQFFHLGHMKENTYLNWWRHGNGIDVLNRLDPKDRFLAFDDHHENPFSDWKKGILKRPIINYNL